MSKSISQNDLRKMMQKAKTNKPESNAKLKKLKLSSRELYLLEQEKKRKEEERKKKQASKRALPQDFFEKKPVKSILKNSSSSSPSISASGSSTGGSAAKRYKPSGVVAAVAPTVKSDAASSSRVEAAVSSVVEEESEGKELPEGFFDDPIQDAKVLHKLLQSAKTVSCFNLDILNFRLERLSTKIPRRRSGISSRRKSSRNWIQPRRS